MTRGSDKLVLQEYCRLVWEFHTLGNLGKPESESVYTLGTLVSREHGMLVPLVVGKLMPLGQDKMVPLVQGKMVLLV